MIVVAVLMTSCQVSIFRIIAIDGNHTTTSVTHMAKNHALDANFDAADAIRSKNETCDETCDGMVADFLSFISVDISLRWRPRMGLPSSARIKRARGLPRGLPRRVGRLTGAGGLVHADRVTVVNERDKSTRSRMHVESIARPIEQ